MGEVQSRSIVAVVVAAGAAMLLAAAACGPSTRAAGPAEPGAGSGSGSAAGQAPASALAPDESRGCGDAAAGLERITRGVRPPEAHVHDALRARCMRDVWPAAAIECFAHGTEADLGKCAALLPVKPRERMFELLGGGAKDRVAVAIALSRLSQLKVGIPECDRFIDLVARMLVCDRMAIETRAQLGTEMADFWSLPTSGLPADAQLRMADVCGRSTTSLEQQAVAAGCAP